MPVIQHPAWWSPLDTIRLRISAASSPAKFREPAFRVLDALQFSPPEVQLDALFLTAVAMSLTIGLDPHEMVTRAKRILPDADGPFTDQFAAMTDYAKGELR
jgi:hypothetical protein